MQDTLQQFTQSYPPATDLASAREFLSLREVENIILQIKGSALSVDESEELYLYLRSNYKTEELGQVRQYLIK